MFQYVSASDADQATALVTLLLTNGNTISVNDGEEWVVKNSTDSGFIMESMASTEADTLKVRDADGNTLGTFYLVYGNGPDELIADCSDNSYCERVCQVMMVRDMLAQST
jgi:hypothetical protein